MDRVSGYARPVFSLAWVAEAEQRLLEESDSGFDTSLFRVIWFEGLSVLPSYP